ncbi:MAG: ATP-binding protein, partial [Burkholderiales bacterium]
RESMQLLRSTLPSTLVLTVSHEEDVPPAMIDPVQVEQVLLNLCINARDAIGAQGTVAIGVRSVTLHGVVCNGCRKPIDGEFVELSARDNGHGIKPEVMERIFEPFFTTKEVGKGTGMGLATVHGIAHEHGGHVLVDSAPGQGATFRVLLPPLADHPGNAAPAEPRSTEHARPRAALSGNVLLVDDEEMVLEFMRDLLEGWGLRVTALSDSVAAHQLLANETNEFDLLITDQTMPQMTGLDLARALKASRRALPVILYTGYADGLSDAQARVAGLAGVLRKPVMPRDLLALLHAHLPGA